MTNLVITKERWEWILWEINDIVMADIQNEMTELTVNDLKLVASVLKNNVPFEVIESMRQEIKDKSNGN